MQRMSASGGFSLLTLFVYCHNDGLMMLKKMLLSVSVFTLFLLSMPRLASSGRSFAALSGGGEGEVQGGEAEEERTP